MSPTARHFLVTALVLGCSLGSPAFAQSMRSAGREASTGTPDGPDVPVPPAIVARDAQGRITMRAVRLVEPLVLDGRLDDRVYQEVEPATDFVQQEPREGEAATEKTDVWLFFDDENVYVTGRMWDSQPHRIVANEMRRDNRNIFQNDNFGFAFDTYRNFRTGYFFQTNPLGGLRDGLVADEGQSNYDWDTVWDVRTGRFANGWTAEIVVPFKSLRFESGDAQVWGVNFRRVVRWKNETSFLAPVPTSYGGRAITMFSLAATLVGIETPRGFRNLEIKPYAIADVVTNRDADPPTSNDPGGDVGVDVKYGLTSSLVADLTFNTDFAQVEADEQQVNLTRFSLFFPEKREFFLEGQGIFEFGGVRTGGGGGGGRGDAPILFFSRRIGLESGETVPIRAGGRVTGRAGAYSIGLLNIQTGENAHAEADATNFTVVRLRRDVLRRSNVGVLMTRRVPTSSGGTGTNEVYGLDANLAFFENVEAVGYYARSRSRDATSDEDSYRGEFTYNGDRYGFQVEHLKVGQDFEPGIGFMRREDFRKNSGWVRFSPRPRSIRAVRKFSWRASLDHFAGLDGTLETRERRLNFESEFENGDKAEVRYGNNYEFLREPFEVADDVDVAVGGYSFSDVSFSYELGPQRKLSGTAEVQIGGFFDGNRTEAGYRGRIELTQRLQVEPRVSINWIDLPAGTFTTHLVSTRTTFTLSPRTFVGALLQYNTSNDSLTSNVRLRWEYQPGSDLFVVYSDGRDTAARGFPALLNRGIVVKFTKLLRL